MMFKQFIFLSLSCFIFTGCTPKKALRYKETVATIAADRYSNSSNPLITVLLLNASPTSTSHREWSDYYFMVKGKKYWGEGYSGYCIGEKFVVRYDTTKFDNDHSYLLYYKPVFLDSEQTASTTGKITKVYGKDLLQKGAVAATFEYDLLLREQDSAKTHFIKYQYFPPGTSVDSLKQHPNKEYKVVYSVENPKRSILFLK